MDINQKSYFQSTFTMYSINDCYETSVENISVSFTILKMFNASLTKNINSPFVTENWVTNLHKYLTLSRYEPLYHLNCVLVFHVHCEYIVCNITIIFDVLLSSSMYYTITIQYVRCIKKLPMLHHRIHNAFWLYYRLNELTEGYWTAQYVLRKGYMKGWRILAYRHCNCC